MKIKMVVGAISMILVSATAISYFSTHSSGNQMNQVVASTKNVKGIPYSQESNLPTVESSASFGRLYHSDAEMFHDADVVALVKVQEQEVIHHSDSLVTTRSKVSVEKSIKGSSASNLMISELGGVVDFSKIQDIGKASDGKPKQAGLVETTIEGSPVMKKGHIYFVFLKKNPDPQWGYNILGSVQGKIRYDEAKKWRSQLWTRHILMKNCFSYKKNMPARASKKLSSISIRFSKLNFTI